MTAALPPNPYVGPFPFQTGQRLYGRTRETDDLINLLISERIVLLHAPSGAGKTSLLQAALLPELAQMRFHIQGPARVNAPPDREDPPEGFNRFVYSAIASLHRNAEDHFQRSELEQMTLPGYITRVFAEMNEESSLLLVFDQFEESLTVDPLNIAAKEAFFKQLGGALEDPRVWALFAIRDDYLGALAPYLPLLPTRLNKRYRLDLLGVESAKEAIRLPARDAGVTVEPAAADRLVENLREMRVQQPDGSLRLEKGPYVEPVHLQVVCQDLWVRPRMDPLLITLADVEAMRSIDDALRQYYIGVVERVSRETGAAEREIRDWVQFQLISSQGLRGQVMRGAGRTQGLDNSVVEKLIDAFLVRKENRLNSVWFELAHDRLIEPVKLANETWRASNLSAFQRKALQWDLQGRSPGQLLQFAELREAENWLASFSGKVTAVEQQYLAFSQVAARQAEREMDQTVNRRTNLADLGWGVIFATDADPELIDALGELIELRRSQAGERREDYFHIFGGDRGYRKGESARDFLGRHGAGTFMAEPAVMPYYLMIVGPPDVIPFEFQYGLDVQYSVGRISFDTPEEYARYARSVVTCETGGFSLPRRLGMFGVHNPDDNATRLSLDIIYNPLFERIRGGLPDWQATGYAAEQATRAQLESIINGADMPTVLFFTGHAMSFLKDDPRQVDQTGALLCSDWPGPKAWKGGAVMPEDYYFTGDNISPQARLLGSVAVLISDNTAGTPELDNFAAQAFRSAKNVIAPRAFVSRLAQRMMAHPNGGALGVIGHVDRLWFYSFATGKILETGLFEGVMRRVMSGHTLGSALEPINQRYAWLSSELLDEFMEKEFGKRVNPTLLASKQTAVIDARNYVLLGDPAARLPLEGGTLVTERPVIEITTPGAQEGPPPAEDDINVPVSQSGMYRRAALYVQQPVSEIGPSLIKAARQPDVQSVVFNGIDGTTGSYLLPPMTLSQLAAIVLSQKGQAPAVEVERDQAESL